MSRDKPDYSLLTRKGRIWIAWKSRTKTRYNDLASTGSPVDAGSFFVTHIDLKSTDFLPHPSPTSPSQAQTLPHYILVKSKKTGGKLRINFKNIFQKFVKRNVGKEIGTCSDPLPYPIIPIHFLEKSLENPSLFFAQNYNKMGRYMLWTAEFGGLPEDQGFCPWENQRLCLRTNPNRKSVAAQWLFNSAPQIDTDLIRFLLSSR